MQCLLFEILPLKTVISWLLLKNTSIKKVFRQLKSKAQNCANSVDLKSVDMKYGLFYFPSIFDMEKENIYIKRVFFFTKLAKN